MKDTNDMSGSSDRAGDDPTGDGDVRDVRDERGPEVTEQLPRTDATQQLPVEDRTGTREPVETTVFGATTPQEGRPSGASAATESEPASGSWPPPVQPRPSGPHAPAILLGLVCLAVAGIVLAQELGNLTVDWGDVGPLGFVAVGAVLVVLGAVGLLGSNRRNARS